MNIKDEAVKELTDLISSYGIDSLCMMYSDNNTVNAKSITYWTESTIDNYPETIGIGEGYDYSHTDLYALLELAEEVAEEYNRERRFIGNLNRQGNWMVENSYIMRETGYYYRKLDKLWLKYHTDQDADYFGIWVNYFTRQVLTFAEGDETLVSCASMKQLHVEIQSMNKFYNE